MEYQRHRRNLIGRPLRAAFALLAACLAACQSVDLYKKNPQNQELPANNKVRFEGNFCTDEAAYLQIKTKFILLIDASASLLITDPAIERQRASRDLFYSNLSDPFSYFRFVFFNNYVTSCPRDNALAANTHFTQAVDQVEGCLNSGEMMNPNNYTEMAGGIDRAKTIIQADIDHTPLRERRLNRYVVILFSDGVPFDGDPNSVVEREETWYNLNLVRQMKELELLGPSVTLHSVFLWGYSQADPDYPRGHELMSEAAQIGGGRFVEVTDAADLDFLQFDLDAIRSMFEVRSLLIYNRNAKLDPESGQSEPDSDGDGLTDAEENALGSDDVDPDSDGDGVSDGIEVYLKSDPLQADLTCNGNNGDADQDGLSDCEEGWVGSYAEVADEDLDGVVSFVEARLGLDPLHSSVATDQDSDSVPDAREALQGTRPDRDETAAVRQQESMRYELVDLGIDEYLRHCYQITVHNVPLAFTLPSGGQPAGHNEIMIYLLQSPSDYPRDFGTLFRGRAEAIYTGDDKRPESGIFEYDFMTQLHKVE
jgi:hypothetical protein